MADVDGDDVRCRWAESSRGGCAGVCRSFTGATLTGVRMHFVCYVAGCLPNYTLDKSMRYCYYTVVQPQWRKKALELIYCSLLNI